MFDKILVPLDGSSVAASVLPYVANIAKRLNASVTLMTALSPATLQSPSHTQIWTEAQTELGEYASRLGAGGVKADTRICPGEAADQVIRVADEEKYGLIIIGTRGHSGLKRGLLGSVTDEVVRSATVPTLVLSPRAVQRSAEEQYNVSSITVPLDGSELAETILPVVTELARKMALPITLLRVVSNAPLAYYAGEAVAIDTTPMEEELEREAADYLSQVGGRLTQQGLSVSTLIIRGSPGLAIVDHLRETERSLVAICTHGRSGIGRLLIGSVADSVIRSSGVPTLVVTPQASQK